MEAPDPQSQHPASEPVGEGDLSEAACAALLEYVDALHRDKPPDRAALVGRFPELAAYLDCLEGLHQMAIGLDEGPLFAAIPAGADRPTEPPATLDLARGGSTAAERGNQSGAFGKYEIVRVLGRGGMGVVYLARQKDLDRQVALKMILSGPSAAPEQIARFRREAKAAAQVQHPNLAGIYEIGEWDGRHYLAMQYIAGPTLLQAAAKRQFSAEEAAGLVATICRTVQHLHERGIVHRDLKPSNILLDEKGQPYVTDFGLVKLLDADGGTRSGDIVGTPQYMSPEQASGKTTEIGPASDIYGLGAILYELLAGRPPFVGETSLDTLIQVLESEPVSPRLLNRAVPRELDLVCLRCLEKDPARRFASAGELADELERFLRGEPLQSPSPSIRHKVRRWSRREPVLAYKLTAIVGCFAIYHLYQLFARDWDLVFDSQLALLLGGWLVATLLLRFLPVRWREEGRVQAGWLILDAVLLTALMIISKGFASALVVFYPLFVLGSGLYFRERLVWLATFLSLASLGVLYLDAYHRDATLALDRPYRHCISMVVVLVIGSITAFQVQRVRMLSRRYDSQS